ncbi:MAG: putative nucleotidyltransferase substrate binding domain-containing protein, partial [Smithellaceae bacterium]|nr:putative nucleotidyltransferase substrate binding domain-containing protein [Smithellaceae bacterium]
GLGLLAGAIRLFSLEKGVDSTSTMERLRNLKDKHSLVGQYGEEFEQAFEFLMSLRIRHQLEQIEAGLEPDNYLNPESLSILEANTLKESFKLIALVQDFIVEEYKQGFSVR